VIIHWEQRQALSRVAPLLSARKALIALWSSQRQFNSKVCTTLTRNDSTKLTELHKDLTIKVANSIEVRLSCIERVYNCISQVATKYMDTMCIGYPNKGIGR
jgi:hypothetical protein